MIFTLEFSMGIAPTSGWIQVDIGNLQNVYLTKMSCDFALLSGGQGKQADGIVQLRLGAFPGSSVIVGSSATLVATDATTTMGANIGCPMATTRVPFEGRVALPTSQTLLFVYDLRTQPGFAIVGEIGSGRISYVLDYGDSDSAGNNMDLLDPVKVEQFGQNLRSVKTYRR